ncbi:MAG: hypothetical protein ACYCVX_15710, partial [Thiobacillus sp.]
RMASAGASPILAGEASSPQISYQTAVSKALGMPDPNFASWHFPPHWAGRSFCNGTEPDGVPFGFSPAIAEP